MGSVIVTGGAGFIGSNLVRALNEKGYDNVVVVDDLTDGTKFRNIAALDLADYLDRDDFIGRVRDGRGLWDDIDAIFHQGACSVTTEWDGRFMMDNNYEYSKVLLEFALKEKIPFLYASSAAVYGDSEVFVEQREYEVPLNVYGYSKLLFDRYVQRLMDKAESQIAGFRYFNVYGQGEEHKGGMASVAWHLSRQILRGENPRLFEGCDGYGDGEQCRDFVYVDDVVDVNSWFLERPDKSGIFNLGTGRAQTFNDVARAVIRRFGRGEIEYIPFPEHLQGRYQSYTQADISALRRAGYEGAFSTVEEGVALYMDKLYGSAKDGAAA